MQVEAEHPSWECRRTEIPTDIAYLWALEEPKITILISAKKNGRLGADERRYTGHTKLITSWTLQDCSEILMRSQFKLRKSFTLKTPPGVWTESAKTTECSCRTEVERGRTGENNEIEP